MYVALASYNTQYLTLPMASCENLVDEAAQIAVIDRAGNIIRQAKNCGKTADGKRRGHGMHGGHDQRSSAGRTMGLGVGIAGAKGIDWKSLWNEGTDAVMDIPIGGVCEILYGAETKEKDEETQPFLSELPTAKNN